MKPRLLIADDHTLIVEALRSLLQPEFEVVGCVEDALSVIKLPETMRPDVVLMDISMPDLSGIEATRQLKAILPGLHVVIVTMHNEPELVTAAFRAGASAYVLKSAAASELILAIRQVLAGRHYVTPLVTKSALTFFMGIESKSNGHDPLTERQKQVLRLVAEGYSRKEIAWRLQITVKTVEFHKAALMSQLELKNGAELIRYAVANGMVAPLASPQAVERTGNSKPQLRTAGS